MATTKIQTGAFPADVVTTAAIDDLSITHAKLHTTMDLSSKTVTLPSAITDTITNKLPLAGGTLTGTLNVTQASTADTIKLTRGTTAHNNMIKFVTGSTDKWIVGQRNDNTDHFRFYSYGTSSDVLSIKTDGNVGIGTTSPSYPLHISGPGHKRLKIEKTDAGGDADLQISSPNDSTGWVLFHDNNSGNNSGVIKYVHSTNKMHFRTNDVDDRLVISSDGNVGINTTGPGAKLSVNGPAALANLGGGSTGSAALYVNTTSGHVGEMIQVLRNGSIKMYMANDGDLALGHSSPSDKLDVQGADNGITIRSATANRPKLSLINGSSTMLTISANNTYGAIGDGSDANRYMAFKAGDVGIGSTSPSAKLHVVDSVSDTISAANAVVKIDGTGGDGLSFGNTQSSPFSSWMQAGYLADSYSPAFNNGYPILINPIGGNVMIGSNVPNSYLHIDKRTTDNTTGRSQFQIRADGSGSRAERIKRITYCYRPLYNQYTFHRIKLGGGVYGAGQTIRYRVTFITGHASGHGFVEGVISLYAHHSTTKMHLTGHTKYLRHYSNGSYYGWTSNPDVDFFFSNNTNANACVIMRVQGHGNHNSNTFDLICDHHIDLEIHGSDHTTNTECTQIGHSAPSDMGTVFSSSTLN